METIKDIVMPAALLINLVLTWITAFFTHLNRKNAVTEERVTEVERHVLAKQETISDRVGEIEASMRAAPSHSDLSALHERINGLAEQLCHLIGENKTQSDLLRALVSREINRP